MKYWPFGVKAGHGRDFHHLADHMTNLVFSVFVFTSLNVCSNIKYFRSLSDYFTKTAHKRARASMLQWVL